MRESAENQGNWRRIWERASDLGMDAARSLEERRKVRICNQSAIIGSVTTLGFGLAYLITDAAMLWRGVLINLVDGLLLASCLIWNAKGRFTIARLLFLVVANVHVLASSLQLGPAVGFQYYYFPFIAVSFLLLSSKDSWLLYAFPIVSFGLFVYTSYVASPEDAWVPIAPEAARVVNIVSSTLTCATLAFIVYLFYADTLRAEALLVKEHERSERLLLNILPPIISKRLKSGQELIADGFDDASVLFADLVGFTELSGRLKAEELATMLNKIFSRFDDLAERFGLEKIKTIGDAYMVASGLPEPRPDHAAALVDMALGMRIALDEVAKEIGHPLELRIGIHSGPVVAGVIGKRKFIYDLWGDTVNTASRMESHGVPGGIQVSEAVRARLGGAFELTSRGVIRVKGKGDMETYLVERRVTAAQA